MSYRRIFMNLTYRDFNNKAVLYRKYRPSYSDQYITYLKELLPMLSGSTVADIGAGTGQHTAIISKLAKTVYAVEPNKEMLEESRNCLKNCYNIHYINGSADNIQISSQFIDYIMVAQAMHLFNNAAVIQEFKRILCPNGKLIITYNTKNQKSDLFLENEKVLQMYCPTYNRSLHATEFSPVTFANLFKNDYRYYRFINDNEQLLDLETFIGRTLSASYAINSANTDYNNFINDLKNVFAKFEINGKVRMELSTVIYSGTLEV